MLSSPCAFCCTSPGHGNCSEVPDSSKTLHVLIRSCRMDLVVSGGAGTCTRQHLATTCACVCRRMVCRILAPGLNRSHRVSRYWGLGLVGTGFMGNRHGMDWWGIAL